MAITSKAYRALLFGLAGAEHQMFYDTHNLVLLKDTYVPDFGLHSQLSDIDASAIDPSGDGYDTTGISLQNQSVAIATDSWALTADPVTISNLTADFRYAVVYKDGPVKLLMFCIDFGETLSYTGEELTVEFTDGVLTLKAL